METRYYEVYNQPNVRLVDLRETPIETKMRQLSTLMASRDLFRPDPDRELHVEGVRERWARIYRAFDG